MRKIFMLVVFSLLLCVSSFSQKNKGAAYVVPEGVSVCDTIWNTPDTPCSYPGGTAALYVYLNDNMKNKRKLTQFSNQRMLLKLLVDVDGAIAATEVLMEVSPEYTNDVITTLLKGPKMTPAKNNGKPVCSYFFLKLNLSE